MSWISWTNVTLGVWLVVAALLLPHAAGDWVVLDAITGLFVAMAALVAEGAFMPVISSAASVIVMLCGTWILVAPFTLGHDRPAASANELVVGLAIVLLAAANVWLKDRRMRW